jgi:hypothetical protein
MFKNPAHIIQDSYADRSRSIGMNTKMIYVPEPERNFPKAQ